MHITVSFNWLLIGGSLALVGASVLAGAVVYCTIYIITAIVHGIYRAVRRATDEDKDDQ